jgi:hypothetical protein
LTKMFKDELAIKDEIQKKLQARIEELEKLVDELTLKLQIPRTHYLFLQEHGKLDEFVEAKMTGKEPVAKWLLLDTNKREIDLI